MKTQKEIVSYRQEQKQLHRKSLSENAKIRRKEIKAEAMEKLRLLTFHNKQYEKQIRISGSGIDEWLNQPHKHYSEKNELLLDIANTIETATYKGVSTFKGTTAHIFETTLCGEATWIVVTEVPGRGATIHSISDNANILTGTSMPA